MRSALKFMRLVLGWLLAASMLSSGSYGMVLCIADDGHIAVEPEHQGPCGSTGDAAGRAHAEAAQAATSPSMSFTGGCVDVSLGLDDVLPVAKDVRHVRLLKYSISGDLSADYAASTYAEDHGTQRLAYGAKSRHSHTLLAQRTVVLRV